MQNQFSRTELLLGKEAMKRLSECRVAVFGIGGVGGYVCEALARSGVGAFDLIDDDKVCESNINRQIIATVKTVGRYKTEVMKERILDINPEAKVNTRQCFFLPENAAGFPFDEYDYVVDAIDTVTAKIELVMRCKEKNVPIISSMGAGNKLDPTQFKVADIYKTNIDPLAKVMRRELKKRGVKKLKVVYSEETPITPMGSPEPENPEVKNPGIENRPDESGSENAERHGHKRRATPGSTAFVPSVAGLIIAGEVIKDLIK
ncbi:MAG: tRNA threonylcarbamoyladenosine dehydratase [Lachnospiraceae bacterium]|nr:tRNA threonylcarbamoyladenosine dehydratase [Lachnospiraceae bacterium]